MDQDPTDPGPTRPAGRVVVSPTTALIVLLSIDVGLIVLYGVSVAADRSGLVVGHVRTNLARLVDANGELTIPTWWESVLFAVATILLAAIAALAGRGSRDRRWWGGLAVIFLLLSIDEATAIHEISVVPLQRLLDVASGPWAATWVYPVGLLMLVVAVVYGRFFLRLPRRTRAFFALAFVIFVVGAAGLEIFEWANADPWVEGRPPVAYVVLVALEELMETVALTIFIVALLVHIRDHAAAGRPVHWVIAAPARSESTR